MFFALCLGNILVPAFFVYYFSVSYDSNQARKHLLKDCPHFFPILSYEYLYLYHPRTADSLLFLLIFFPVFNILTFGSIFLYCIRVYIEKSKFFSKTTKQLHIRLIINMALTVLIPTLSHGSLLVVTNVLIRNKLELDLWIPTLSWFTGSTHGIMNCVALVMLNDYYRKRLKYDIRFLFCSTVKKFIPAAKVSVGISVIL
ncbi:unnamed protein product [Auanema sp. JU1783]|nr:unnamed protein product [Auanema sp. JU1783]